MTDLTRPSPLDVAAGVAVVGAVGLLLLAIAHTGLEVPVLSSFGPRGGAVPPAVVGFTVGAGLFAAVAWGLRRRRRWAWGTGVVVSALAVLSGIAQYRGATSAVGIAVALVLGGLLVMPASRAAVRR